jgi:hypothetical protein
MRKNTYNGYEHLAGAIVKQACEDYLHIRKRLYRINGFTSDGRILRGRLKEIELFFESNWFSTLSNLDGVELKRNLDRMYESWKLDEISKQKSKKES